MAKGHDARRSQQWSVVLIPTVLTTVAAQRSASFHQTHGSKKRREVGAAMAPICYPIALVLDGKPCLVVGGGEIADEKLDALLLAGAVVTVVSPEVRPRIAALAAEARSRFTGGRTRASDLDGVRTSPSPPRTTGRSTPGWSPRRARRAFSRRRSTTFPTAISSPWPSCAAAISSSAISTNGRSPAFARWMRERLDTELPAEYGDLLAVLGDVRDTIKARGPDSRSTSTGRRRSPTTSSLPCAPATGRRPRRASTSVSRPGSSRRWQGGVMSATGQRLDRRRGSRRSRADHGARAGADPHAPRSWSTTAWSIPHCSMRRRRRPSGSSPVRRGGSPRSSSARSRRC